METLIDIFESFAKRNKELFIYHTGVRRLVYDYKFLYEQSLRMASYLQKQGIKKGDRVAIWAPNSPWWGVCFWGTVLSGGVVVPVDFISGSKRCETILKLSGSKFLIQSQKKIEKINFSKSVLIEDLEFILSDFLLLKTLPKAKDSELVELVFTSGTTGNPKGVMLTHRNLIANINQINKVLKIASEYKILSLLPLSHMFEQMGGFLIPTFNGASIVYLNTLKPSAISEALEKENIYILIAVPRLLQALKHSAENELKSKNLFKIIQFLFKASKNMSSDAKKFLFFPIHKKFGSKFKFFVSGGSALDKDTFNFWQNLGFKVIEGYGLSECSPVLTVNNIDKQILGSVGKVLDKIVIKLDNGEILAKGENIFSSYFQNKKATEEAFTNNGFFRTGDFGEFDNQGNLYIKGRKKETIVTADGVNIYPDEIEQVLNKIQGVRESCVVGLNKNEGEEVHAVLILDKEKYSPEEIVRKANNILDPTQQITGFTIWKENEFPKTPTLKIQKFKVLQGVKNGQSENETLADKLINLISRVTTKPASLIKEDSLLISDLGLTSIGRLELVNYIEQEFRIDLEDTSIDKDTTLASLRNTIEKREKIKTKTRFRYWANTDFGRKVRKLIDVILQYPLFKLFFDLRVKGLENILSLKTPVIFIANHRSFIDQSPVAFSLPEKLRYKTATLAREEFFFDDKNNFLQKIIKRLMFEFATAADNVFPFPQKRGFRRYLKYMGELADQGVSILIFPEGTRSFTTKLLPFMPGLGIIAKELKIPVVPVRIEGLEKIFPRGAVFPKRGKCTVVFGKPLYFATETTNEITKISRDALEALSMVK